MRIGIDLDNTMCSTTKMANEIFKEKYNGRNMYDLPKKEQYDFIQAYASDVFYDCPLEKGAKKVINELAENNDIYIITARAGKHVNNIENITINYLWDNNIRYNCIYFGHDSKIGIYKELKLDIMLDDDYDVYKELNDKGLNVVMYDNYQNKGKIGNKVKTWEEFKELIERS